MKRAARAGATALAFFVAGCNHLALFEDTPQTQAHAPAPRKAAAHRAQDKQQTAALRGTTNGGDAGPANAASDVDRAARLRAQALEQMNRGAIDDAVANLKLAATLDPGNNLIRRDLDRATRIQSTVQRTPS